MLKEIFKFIEKTPSQTSNWEDTARTIVERDDRRKTLLLVALVLLILVVFVLVVKGA